MDRIDREILYYLDMDSRRPVTDIAHRVGEKSERINYRLKKLFQEGVVKRCFVEINPAKAGYSSYKVYLQFQGVDKERIEEMYSFLTNVCRVGWVATCLGRWDMIIEILAKDRHDFSRIYARFHRRYFANILNKAVGVTLEQIFINKKWLCPDRRMISASICNVQPVVLTDDTDERLIRHLALKGRDPVNKIAAAVGMPTTTVSARIKSLMRKRIILNFRTDLDLKRFSKVYCKAFIYFSGYREEEEQYLVDFCIRHPDVVFIAKCVAPWDMEIEAHSPSLGDFTAMLIEMEKRYPGIVRNFEAVVINKESGAFTIPMG